MYLNFDRETVGFYLLKTRLKQKGTQLIYGLKWLELNKIDSEVVLPCKVLNKNK